MWEPLAYIVTYLAVIVAAVCASEGSPWFPAACGAIVPIGAVAVFFTFARTSRRGVCRALRRLGFKIDRGAVYVADDHSRGLNFLIDMESVVGRRINYVRATVGLPCHAPNCVFKIQEHPSIGNRPLPWLRKERTGFACRQFDNRWVLRSGERDAVERIIPPDLQRVLTRMPGRVAMDMNGRVLRFTVVRASLLNAAKMVAVLEDARARISASWNPRGSTGRSPPPTPG